MVTALMERQFLFPIDMAAFHVLPLIRETEKAFS